MDTEKTLTPAVACRFGSQGWSVPLGWGAMLDTDAQQYREVFWP